FTHSPFSILPPSEYYLIVSLTSSSCLFTPFSPFIFFFSCSASHQILHSFPTRRSSDLVFYQAGLCGDCAGNADSNGRRPAEVFLDRKSTRLNSSHGSISYAVFCLKKKSQRS